MTYNFITHRVLAIVAFILVLWKLILFLVFPEVSVDASWTLSHLFSVLSGDIYSSSFAENFDGNIFLTCVEEIVLLPFFYVLPTNTNSLIIVAFIFISVSTFLFHRLFVLNQVSPLLSLLFIISFLGTTYTYGMRSEGYITPFLIVLIIQLSQFEKDSKVSRLLLVSLMASIAAFIHPAGGIAAGILILYNLSLLSKPWRSLITLLFTSCVFTYAITQGNFMSYINFYANSNEAESHSFDYLLLPKFLFYCSGLIVTLALVVFKNSPKNGIAIAISAITLLFFGRSYYFVYLIVVCSNLLINSENKGDIVSHPLFKKILSFTACVFFLNGLFFSHLLPTFLILENPKLPNHLKLILHKTNEIGKTTESGLIWVSSPLGMEVIDQENSRLHHHFYSRMAGEKITLMENDIMLFRFKENLNDIMSRQVSNNTYKVEELIPPMKGKLRIGTLFKERSSEYGLWRVSIEK